VGKTSIEWCDYTFNHVRGCTKVAAGCAHCYADTLSKRNPWTLGIWGPDGTRVVASESMWAQPVKWNAAAACCCRKGPLDHQHEQGCPQMDRPRVFVASLADWAEDWQGSVVDSRGREVRKCECGAWTSGSDTCKKSACDESALLHLTDVRRRLFALIDATQNLDYLLLTKRAENIRSMWPATQDSINSHHNFYRSNVWIGTSVATQSDAERNIPHLLKCRDLSPVLFVSAEPLLENIDLSRWLAIEIGRDGNWRKRSKFGERPMIDWVIAGGESGPHSRPMHPDWVRSIRDQCAAAGVPFLFKQHGEFLHESQWASCTVSLNAVFDNEHQFVKVGKKAAGRMLDGVIHDGYPTKLN